MKPNHRRIVEAVFKKEFIPACEIWIKGMQPDKVDQFESIFTRLIQEDNSQVKTRQLPERNAVSSKYTVPEWNVFHLNEPKAQNEKPSDDPLRRPSTSNLTYGHFKPEDTKFCRGVPTRNRNTDFSQIYVGENSPAAIDNWGKNTLNSTYREELCHQSSYRPIATVGADQMVVYCKGLLNAKASERAKQHVSDPVWLRLFREFCRDLRNTIDGTAYRSAFTTVKEVNKNRCTHPKWKDPELVTNGKGNSPEKSWRSETRSAHRRFEKQTDRYSKIDQHKAGYNRPFDLTPQTDKRITTCLRGDYVDHLAMKDSHPIYFQDMSVRMPPGTGPMGTIVGDGKLH